MGATPPEAAPRCGGAQAGEDNKAWLMRSRGGHKIFLDDKNGNIVLESSSGKSCVEMKGDTINIVQGGSDINIYAAGNINVTAAGDMNFTADGNIMMHADGTFDSSSGGAMSHS